MRVRRLVLLAALIILVPTSSLAYYLICGHVAGTAFGPLINCYSRAGTNAYRVRMFSVFDCPLSFPGAPFASFAGHSEVTENLDLQPYPFFGGPWVWTTAYGWVSYGEQSDVVADPNRMRFGAYTPDGEFHPTSPWFTDLGEIDGAAVCGDNIEVPY